jgi:hypothetical protein
MRRHPPGTILIGDSDDARIACFREVLEDYRTSITLARDWETFTAIAADPEQQSFDLVIVCSYLGGKLRGKLVDRVNWIRAFCPNVYCEILGVYEGSYVFDPVSRYGEKSNVLGFKWSGDILASRDELRAKVDPYLNPLPPLPIVILRSPGDFLLEQQICGLDEDGQLAAGKARLARLIRKLGFSCQTAHVDRLTQGFSGALVFKIKAENGGVESGVYVVKITREDPSNRWRLKREIEHWTDIRNTLFRHNLTAHIPELIVPRPEVPESSLVTDDNLQAVCYRFLGEPIAGRFDDLESVYLEHDPMSWAGAGDSAGRQISDPAGDLIGSLLDLLQRAWYQPRSTGAVGPSNPKLEPRRLWSPDVAPSNQVRAFPPYQLTAGEKALALRSLEELASFGQRLMGRQRWEMCKSQIQDWVQGHHRLFKWFEKAQLVLVSGVHGDLNAKNILMWQEGEQNRPFLIDFACYQPNGHVMQDFARLEAEIKFALMDREHGSGVHALDHSSGRLPLWCLIERDLVSPDWAKATIPLGGRERFVDRALQLVKGIRTRAREIRTEAWAKAHPGSNVGGDKGRFLVEYGSALLFHTLRHISYQSLSPFKRLLALFSTVELIEFLRAYSHDHPEG